MTLFRIHILFLTAFGVLFAALVQVRHPLADDGRYSDKSRLEWRAPRPRSYIVVAPLLKANAPAQAPLSVEIVPPDNLSATSLIRIQGLPAPATLSAGQAIAAGTWAVPVLSLDNLNINVPANVAGRSELIISLIARDGTVLAEQKSALLIEPANIVASPSSMPVAMPTERVTTTPVSPAPSTTNAPAFATTVDNQSEPPQDANLLAETERLYRRALAIDEKSLGLDHILVANRIIDLAVLLHKTSRLAEAEPLYRRALEINEKNLGSEHPMVAIALNNLAVLLLARSRIAEAEPLMRRALAIDEKNLGPDDMTVAVRLNNLALLLQSTKRLADAELLYRRALAIREKNFGPNHPSVGIALKNLALLLMTMNSFAEAESLIRRASTLDQRQNGFDHPDESNDSRADGSPPALVDRPDGSRPTEHDMAPRPDSTDHRDVQPMNRPEEQPAEQAVGSVVRLPMEANLSAVATQNEIDERPTEQGASSADEAIAQAMVDVPVAEPRIITAGRPADETTRPTDAAIVRAPIVAAVPAASPDKNPEEPPVERAVSPAEAAFLKAPIAAGIPIAGIQERRAERFGNPSDASGMQRPVVAEVPVVASQKEIDERPTERVASLAGAGVAQGAVDIPEAIPRIITAGRPAEGTTRPTDATIMRAPIAAAPPDKYPEEPPVERTVSPAEAAVVTAPIAAGIAIAGSRKEIREWQTERIQIPTDAAGVQGPVAAEVSVVASQKKIDETPTERAASLAGAAVAQGTVDIPAAKPRIIIAGQPAEGTTRPTHATIVRAPIAAAPHDKYPEEPPVERTLGPAEAAFVRAPIAGGIAIAGSKKEIRDRQSKQVGIPADSTGVQDPVAEVPAASQKKVDQRPIDQMARLADTTRARAKGAGEVPTAASQKSSEVRPAERAAGSAGTVLMRAPIAALIAVARDRRPQEQSLERPAEAPGMADVRAPVAVDVLAATPQQNKGNRPTARSAKTEAAIARTVDVPAGAPHKKRTEEQPVERIANHVEDVRAPLVSDAQERRVEFAASPANMPVEQAPATKAVPVPAPEKTLERSAEKIDITKLGGTLFSRVFGALTEYESDTVRERTNSVLRAGRASGRASGRRNSR
jgi:tetratricopeptide (TPR) repeat protein